MHKIRAIALAALLSAAIPGIALGQNMSDIAGGIGGPDFATSIDTLSEATSVNVLLVSSLEGDRAVLDEALAAKEQDVESLRAQVDQSDIAKQALEAQGLTVANVVGIGASPDGAVTLYADETLSMGQMSGFRTNAAETAADAAAAGNDPESVESAAGSY